MRGEIEIIGSFDKMLFNDLNNFRQNSLVEFIRTLIEFIQMSNKCICMPIKGNQIFAKFLSGLAFITFDTFN